MGRRGRFSMSFDDVWIISFCTVGVGAGLYWFAKGFRTYRRYRYLADTPELPIRSIPMGLVHVHGMALGEQVISSPVTRTPCVFYRVDIEASDLNSTGRGGWRHYKTDCAGAPFYLKDKSGRAQVDAFGAELDLPWSLRCRTGSAQSISGLADLIRNWKSFTAPNTIPVPDEDLRAYVGSLGPASAVQYRLTEYCLRPGHWYDVIGTCVENPRAKDESDRNLIIKGDNEPTYLISFRSELSLQSTLRNRALAYIVGGAGLSILCLAIVLARLNWL